MEWSTLTPFDTTNVESLELDEDLMGIPVDQTRFRGMAKPTKKHLEAIKRIFRYLKGTINMGLWYPKDNAMSLTAYADADHAGCQDSRRGTSGSAQFLGDMIEPWMRSQLKYYGFQFNKIPLYSETKVLLLSSNNSSTHDISTTDIRLHPLHQEQVEMELVELYFRETNYQLADIPKQKLYQKRSVRIYTPMTWDEEFNP
ncbi:hypothetical protein Tco_0936150 [Tanacetum coccineum]